MVRSGSWRPRSPASASSGPCRRSGCPRRGRRSPRSACATQAPHGSRVTERTALGRRRVAPWCRCWPSGDAPSPFPAIQWLKESPNTKLLARHAADGHVLSHELLDELLPSRNQRYVRQLLLTQATWWNATRASNASRAGWSTSSRTSRRRMPISPPVLARVPASARTPMGGPPPPSCLRRPRSPAPCQRRPGLPGLDGPAQPGPRRARSGIPPTSAARSVPDRCSRRTQRAGDGRRRNWMYELVARDVLRHKLTNF